MPYVWNSAQARYRNTVTGKFVSRADVLSFFRGSLDASSNEFKTLGSAIAKSELSPKDFSSGFRRELKDEIIRQYILGRGGVGSMQQSDWGRVGAMLKEQYAFASGFEKAIPGLTEAATVARANLYAKASGAAFYTAQRVSAKASDSLTEEYWELGDAEHCDDCEQLNSLGWVPIGKLPTVPRAGATACLVNCECGIRFR